MNNSEIEIITFEEKYSKYFYDLNVEWLKTYFYVEPYDEMVLSNPKNYIIDNGGFIFFLKYNSKIVGTVALINKEECYELSKMAISPNYQGLKFGQKLMDFCIEFSKKQEWEQIMLYSNTKLEPAIKLYYKVGFKEVPLEKRAIYKRSNIKMILDLN